MADLKSIEPFVSTEEEVDVEAETAAAIRRGIRAAEEGKVVPQWISKFSTPSRCYPGGLV